MANKSNLTFESSPLTPEQLALEAAQQERDQHIADAQLQSNSKPEKSRVGGITIDVSDITPDRPRRFTRTFTLSEETDAQLSVAAQRLNMPKSTILEKAFAAWWSAVQSQLGNK